jgi:hypothetical protein
MVNKGRILIELGKYDEALDKINDSLIINSTSSYAWLSKGEAQPHKAIEIEPGYETAGTTEA